MSVRKLYYLIKPLIPRNVQIGLRRMLVQRQLKRHGDVWPVNEKAAKQPEGWSGWPGGKRFALVLTHDVDTARGQERCRELLALEQRLGFRSAFNFVPERYAVSSELRRDVVERGFEVAVHGLNHDGKLFESRKKFDEQAVRINHYLKGWNSVGFVSPSMHHNLEWTHDLNIEYDISTFDTDPFEPQPDGVATIFPFFVQGRDGRPGYVELPYTLPQDFTLFSLMKEKNIDIWKKKLDWIAGKGGMALLISHPDYMNGSKGRIIEEYPMDHYKEFLEYVNDRYRGQYWNALPKEMSRFWRENMVTAVRKADPDRCVLSR
jgi:peptidoglycan/xylan/chitin deacetylase (PgdA/CDA1 family)